MVRMAFKTPFLGDVSVRPELRYDFARKQRDRPAMGAFRERLVPHSAGLFFQYLQFRQFAIRAFHFLRPRPGRKIKDPEDGYPSTGSVGPTIRAVKPPDIRLLNFGRNRDLVLDDIVPLSFQYVKQVGDLDYGDVLFPVSAVLDYQVIADDLGQLFSPTTIAIYDVAVYHSSPMLPGRPVV